MSDMWEGEIHSIQRIVAQTFGVTVKDLVSDRRNKGIVIPRQIAMWMCRTLTTASFPVIGRHFGDRDHSTVIHASNKAVKILAEDAKVKGLADSAVEEFNKKWGQPCTA